MFLTTKISGLAAASLLASSVTLPIPQHELPAETADHAIAALPAGKATGSSQYGLIGENPAVDSATYGVTVDSDGAIWYTATGGSAHGVNVYRPGTFAPDGGDYRGNGGYADGTGYLGSAWHDPIRFANRDSTVQNPAGGTEPWAEPRGIEALEGGGIAVNDTNGNVSVPPGTVFFFNDQQERIGSAGVAGDNACSTLAEGELAWGPYVAVRGDRLFAPYENCNVVSVFGVPGGEPLYRLTGEGQTVGQSANGPVPSGPGNLSHVYGVSTDGEAFYTSDLGDTRSPQAGMVQRWFIDDASESWTLDTDFGVDGALTFPGKRIYQTIVAPDSTLYVIPKTGNIEHYTSTGDHLGSVTTAGLPYDEARDLAITKEGWLVMTAKTGSSVRLLAESPSPVTGLSAEHGSQPGSIVLSWNEPEHRSGQAPLLDYVVEQSTDDGETWQIVQREASTEHSRTLTGLGGEAYSFRVTGYSEAGRGDSAVIAGVDPEPVESDISIELVGAAPAEIVEGNTVTWTATVTNTGNAPLSDVIVDFELGPGDFAENDLEGTLEAGESVTVTAASPITPEQLEAASAEASAYTIAVDVLGTSVVDAAEASVALTEHAVTTPAPPGGKTPEPAPAEPLARTGGGSLLEWLALATVLIAAGAAGMFARTRRLA